MKTLVLLSAILASVTASGFLYGQQPSSFGASSGLTPFYYSPSSRTTPFYYTTSGTHNVPPYFYYTPRRPATVTATRPLTYTYSSTRPSSSSTFAYSTKPGTYTTRPTFYTTRPTFYTTRPTTYSYTSPTHYSYTTPTFYNYAGTSPFHYGSGTGFPGYYSFSTSPSASGSQYHAQNTLGHYIYGYSIPEGQAQVQSAGPAFSSYSTSSAVGNQHHSQDGAGQYSYGYTTADGQSKFETRGIDGRVHGKFSYMDPTGKFVETTYTADENGFRAHGDHLIKAPDAAVVPAAATVDADDISDVVEDAYDKAIDNLEDAYKKAKDDFEDAQVRQVPVVAPAAVSYSGQPNVVFPSTYAAGGKSAYSYFG